MIDLSERKIRFFVTQLRWTPRCELRDYRKLEFHHILGRLFRGEMSCGKRIRYNRATSRDLHQSYVTERKLSAQATDQRSPTGGIKWRDEGSLRWPRFNRAEPIGRCANFGAFSSAVWTLRLKLVVVWSRLLSAISRLMSLFEWLNLIFHGCHGHRPSGQWA